MPQNIVDSYLQFVSEGRKKYGEKTIVFLECGSFFELYDIVSAETSPHLRCCQEELGILVTRRNKLDPSSPYLAGIPSHSIRRFNKILLQRNYTIIFVTQRGEAPNITREVTKTLSPGCNLSEEVHENTDVGQSILLTLLIEEDDDDECFAHLCTFDANCGKTHLETIQCNTEIATVEIMFTTLQDLLHTQLFHELCVYCRSRKSHFFHKLSEFTTFWKDNGKLVHEFNIEHSQLDYMFQRSFQEQFLERVYSSHKNGFCSIWEALHLECTEPSCVASLVMLLHWIQLHDGRLINRLQVPESHQSGIFSHSNTSSMNHKHVHCYNEMYAKLNIFDDKQNVHCVSNETRSLFSLLNHTKTKMGERLLRERLVKVCTNEQVIKDRYDLVDALLDGDGTNNTFNVLKENLQCIDLERMYRRFSVGNLQPHDIPRILKSQAHLYELIRYISCELEENHTLRRLLPRDKHFSKSFLMYQEKMQSIFDTEKCENVNFSNLNNTLFHVGQYQEIDDSVQQLQQQKNCMDVLAKSLMSCVPNMKLSKNTIGWIHVKSNDKDGFWLDVTKTRFKQLKKALDSMNDRKKQDFCRITNNVFSIDDLAYDMKNKHNVKISGTKMKTLSHSIQYAQQILVGQVKEIYIQLLQNLHHTYYDKLIAPVIKFIAKLDVAFSTASVSSKYGYTRPQLVDANASSFDAKSLRHPLIERLLVKSGKCEAYVANDVQLSSTSSWLLYGVNSVGKSSLLKSIAIAILMAQAGLFVSASSLHLSPYHKLFARTGNDDNIHMAHSSFVKEMTEVRHIVQNVDTQSLVIADELCASTELNSAIDIVVALLMMLTDKQATYAFATHLFAIQKHPCIQHLLHEKKCLMNFHLQVRFDNNKLIFDRTLSPGLPSNRAYGVLVADKVIRDDMFSSFLQQVQSHTNTTHNQQHTHTQQHTHNQSSHIYSSSQQYTSILSASLRTHCYDSCTTLSRRLTGDARPINRVYNATHPSRYNRKLWTEECAICHYRPLSNKHIPLDTHHIREQRCANHHTGLIEHRFHKNERHNLVTLCKQCHRKIDTKELIIEGYVHTSEGSELVWYEPSMA